MAAVCPHCCWASWAALIWFCSALLDILMASFVGSLPLWFGGLLHVCLIRLEIDAGGRPIATLIGACGIMTAFLLISMATIALLFARRAAIVDRVLITDFSSRACRQSWICMRMLFDLLEDLRSMKQIHRSRRCHGLRGQDAQPHCNGATGLRRCSSFDLSVE